MYNLNKIKILFLVVALLLITAFTIFNLMACTTNNEKETLEEADTLQETDTSSENSGEETTDKQTQQTIEVIAKGGGYSPKKINAKAGQSTTLIMISQNAYGCERAFVLPQLKVSQILPENGKTIFDLGVQEKGTTLLGVCSMGMYYFEIFFN